MNTFLISSLDINFGLVWTDSHYEGLVINPFHVGQKNFAWEGPNGVTLGVVLFQVQWEGEGAKEVTSEGWGRFSRDWGEGCRKGSRRGHSSTSQEHYYYLKLCWLHCNGWHICEHLTQTCSVESFGAFIKFGLIDSLLEMRSENWFFALGKYPRKVKEIDLRFTSFLRNCFGTK